jgi:peroxiredoxin
MKSVAVPIATTAPDFALPDLAGSPHRLSDHAGRHLVLLFYRGHW